MNITRRRIVLFILAASTLGMPIARGQSKGKGDVVVCVGSDSIMRLPASGKCSQADKSIDVAGSDAQKDLKQLEPPDGNPLNPNDKGAGSNLLSKIERQVRDLEKYPSIFEVVNKEGDVIFSVAPEKVQVYNNNNAAAAILATSAGAEFVGRLPNDHLSAFLGALGTGLGVRLSEGGARRLDLLRQEAGNYAFKIPVADGVSAGIGQSQGGPGALLIGDSQGGTRAAMSVIDGKGAVSIFNSAGQRVVSLTESAEGGGVLGLSNNNADAVVKMGIHNDYGIVETFPLGTPYVVRSGLPGSYFLGCKGGPSCVP